MQGVGEWERGLGEILRGDNRRRGYQWGRRRVKILGEGGRDEYLG